MFFGLTFSWALLRPAYARVVQKCDGAVKLHRSVTFLHLAIGFQSVFNLAELTKWSDWPG